MPSALGRLFLPTLEEIRRSHPKVTLDISLSDRHCDVIAEGWDLVIRIGELPEQGEMTVRKLCTLRHGLYASPQYIKRRGRPSKIGDLETHEAAVFRQAAGTIRPWTLDDGHRRFEFLPASIGVIVSDGQALVDAVVEGFGIAQICDQSAQPHVSANRLERVLPEADVEGPPVHALVPLGRGMPKKTRLVLDALADLMKRPIPGPSRRRKA
jgi:DNA-binding transcriptional LysR family regulator